MDTIFLVENCMALDLLLAEQGGTCKVVSDSCCTRTPDVSDNLTSLRDHLRALNDGMHRKDSPSSSFGFLSWFTSG